MITRDDPRWVKACKKLGLMQRCNAGWRWRDSVWGADGSVKQCVVHVEITAVHPARVKDHDEVLDPADPATFKLVVEALRDKACNFAVRFNDVMIANPRFGIIERKFKNANEIVPMLYEAVCEAFGQ